MTINRFNAQELCSRKLREIVSSNPAAGEDFNESELKEAINELAERRQHLAKLAAFEKPDGSH